MPDTDKELAKALQVAKKKPRNFAIVAKGPNPQKLLVSKKPIRDGEVQKAKKEYQGNAVCRGVCCGAGDELLFRVTADQPAIAEPKFKLFLKEQTGLSLKPRFEIVEELAEVNEEGPDGELSGEGTPDVVGGGETPSPGPQPPLEQPPQDPLGQQVLAALSKLTPSLKTAVATHPERKGDLLRLLQAVQQDLKTGKSPDAKVKLIELAGLVKELTTTGPEPEAKPTPTSPSPEPGPQVAKLALLWQQAADRAAEQIARLQTRLREPADPQLTRVADVGLQGIQQRLQGGLPAALTEFDQAMGEARQSARTKLQPLLAEFQKFVQGDPVIGLLDENPFGIKVTLRTTLGAALESVAQAVGV